MRPSIIVTLIICGSCLVIAPWVYSSYHNHLAAALLEEDGTRSVSLYNESTTNLKWWGVMLGSAMIGVAVSACFRWSK